MENTIITEETMKKLKRIFAIKWTIYIMLVLSIFFYFAITVILKRTGFKSSAAPGTVGILKNIFGVVSWVIKEKRVSADVGILKNIFGVVSALIILLALFIRKNLNDPASFIASMRKRKIEPEMVNRFTQKIDDPAIKKAGDVILLSNTIDILSWALCEFIAVLGLVLFFLSEDVLFIQAFGGVSLLAMAFFRPNFTTFLNLVSAAIKESKTADPTGNQDLM